MKKFVVLNLLIFSTIACSAQQDHNTEKVVKSDAEWKEILSPEAYYVLRESGTELRGTGKYNKFYEEGKYVCAGCGAHLFDSEAKYDSRSGWPSFDRAASNFVSEELDGRYGMVRSEIHCNRCDGHLGHVFDDGPRETTGLRYCVNSVSLKFIPAEKEDKK